MDEKENVQKTEKKGINKLFLIGGGFLLLIVLAGVFFIGYNMLAGGNNNDDKTTIGPVYQTEEYTVNLLDAGGRRFLRTQFSVEVDNKKVLSEINTKLPMFNHTVLRVLGNVLLQI
jgi:flagellar basal body-associated protein FliL